MHEMARFMTNRAPGPHASARMSAPSPGVRGAEDATSAASVREIVDAMNAGSADRAFCAYDEVENAGSCVFLDRADYFCETLDIVVEKSDA